MLAGVQLAWLCAELGALLCICIDGYPCYLYSWYLQRFLPMSLVSVLRMRAGSYILFTHMMAQRKRVMKGKQKV